MDTRLDIGSLDPRKKSGRDEDIVNARAVVGGAGGDLRVPAYTKDMLFALSGGHEVVVGLHVYLIEYTILANSFNREKVEG